MLFAKLFSGSSSNGYGYVNRRKNSFYSLPNIYFQHDCIYMAGLDKRSCPTENKNGWSSKVS